MDLAPLLARYSYADLCEMVALANRNATEAAIDLEKGTGDATVAARKLAVYDAIRLEIKKREKVAP